VNDYDALAGAFGLLSMCGGVLIRPLIGAVLLMLAARWVVNLDITFGKALVTELAAVGANIVTLLAFGAGITALEAAAGPAGLDETAITSLGGVYLLVCLAVHAWVVHLRHRAGFGPSLLIVLTMAGIVLGVGLLATLGIFALFAAAGA